MKNILILSCFFFACAEAPKPPQSVQEMKICRIMNLGDYKDFPNCFAGKNPDGTLITKPEIVSQIDFNKTIDKRILYTDFSRVQPQSPVHSSSVVGYIIPNGKAHDVIFFDNGPDFFQEGLARFIGSNGKTGFINQELQEALPPVHDFVSPFDEGKAYFCNGCKSQADGEHQKIVGGTWGIMDKKGKILKGPMNYDKFFQIKKKKASSRS